MLYDSNNSTRYKDALANYDARKYHICAPHDGTKGLSFRRFANDFLTNIATFESLLLLTLLVMLLVTLLTATHTY